MKLKVIQEISDTVDYFFELICGQDLSYEQVKQKLMDDPEEDYTIKIVVEHEDLFDVDVGLMCFTVYKDEQDGFRIGDNATYYIYGDNGEVEDTIDVEL